MHCVCEMQERSSHVSTCTTKDELDGVEEWGRGGGGVCMGGRTFTYTIKAKWNGGWRGL